MHTNPPHLLARPALALALLAAACAAGCAGKRSSPDAAPEPAQIARQIDSATVLVRQAQRFELQGKENEAIDEYRKALMEYRELPVAWNNLGNLLMKRGDNLAAADAFKTASELSPTDPRPVHNLGTLWETLGYTDDAARWYDEALKRDENYLPALRRMLVIEETRNRPDDQTLEHIRRGLLVEKDPWWINRFKQARLRLEQMLRDTQADALAR